MNINKEELVNSADTELLDSQIDQITDSFIEEHFLDNDEAEQLEMLVAKSMKLGELYERKKWQEKATPEGFVLVDKKQTEDWYLDDHEGMWWDQDGIDNSLCDLDPGQVQAVEHKEYLITESNTLYAAKVWDESNDQVGYWEFFKTKDEADKAAAYCKAKFKGEPVKEQEQSHD